MDIRDPQGLFDVNERKQDILEAIASGAVTIEHKGGDRYAIKINKDLPFDSDYMTYTLASLEAADVLPIPGEFGWESHGKDKDGNFIISVDEPEGPDMVDVAAMLALSAFGAGIGTALAPAALTSGFVTGTSIPALGAVQGGSGALLTSGLLGDGDLEDIVKDTALGAGFGALNTYLPGNTPYSPDGGGTLNAAPGASLWSPPQYQIPGGTAILKPPNDYGELLDNFTAKDMLMKTRMVLDVLPFPIPTYGMKIEDLKDLPAETVDYIKGVMDGTIKPTQDIKDWASGMTESGIKGVQDVVGTVVGAGKTIYDWVTEGSVDTTKTPLQPPVTGGDKEEDEGLVLGQQGWSTPKETTPVKEPYDDEGLVLGQQSWGAPDGSDNYVKIGGDSNTDDGLVLGGGWGTSKASQDAIRQENILRQYQQIINSPWADVDDGAVNPPVTGDIDWEVERAPEGLITPYEQPMGTNYTPFTLGPVEQKPLFETYIPKLLAPEVLPADNSGQPTFEQWKQTYEDQGGSIRGLLGLDYVEELKGLI